MPSPKTSAQNLARWRKRAGMRTSNESRAIKHCIWQWRLLSPGHRKPATQGELAKVLGVSRPYVSTVIKRMFLDAPIGSLTASPVTPAHVIAMRKRQEQLVCQQEEARQDAELWQQAWRQEESNARREGWWPEEGMRRAARSEDAEDEEDAEWDRFDEAVRKALDVPLVPKD